MNRKRENEMEEIVTPKRPRRSTKKGNLFICRNKGCDAEYTSREYLERHRIREHTTQLEPRRPSSNHRSGTRSTKHAQFATDENDVTLCIFCCSYYQLDGPEMEKLHNNDPYFIKFCKGALRQQGKQVNADLMITSLSTFKNPLVCQSCFNKIATAMGTMKTADELELRIHELKCQLNAELANLLCAVEMLYEEMKMIEGVVKNADLSSLEDYLAMMKLESSEEKKQSSVVHLLRDGVSSVLDGVQEYCTRIKRQQTCVGLPQAISKRTSPVVSREPLENKKLGKKRKTNKTKSISPRFDVKEELDDRLGIGDHPSPTEEQLDIPINEDGENEEVVVKTEVDSDAELSMPSEAELTMKTAVSKEATSKIYKGSSRREEKSVSSASSFSPMVLRHKSATTAVTATSVLSEDEDELSIEDPPDDQDFRSESERDETSDDNFSDYEIKKTSKKIKNYAPETRKESMKNKNKVLNSKKKSDNRPMQQYDIDMSRMSEFRRRLLCRIFKKNAKKSNALLPSDDSYCDPRANYRYEYNRETDTLLLGDVPIIILDEHELLQCSRCEYTPPSKETAHRAMDILLFDHILGKHLSVYQCPQCPSTLTSYSRYVHHIKGHQMRYKCDICEKPLFSDEALRRHRWTHQSAEEMEEAIRLGVKDPRRKHDPTLTFQCTICGKTFSKQMNLQQHELTHSENRRRIVCNLCGKAFLPSTFDYHRKYSCFPEGCEPARVACQLCSSTFKNARLLSRHMDYKHGPASVEKPFKCDLCGKGFATNGLLQRHIERHSDARPYVCSKGCGASYKTRKDSSRHEKKCEGYGTPMMRKNRDLKWSMD